MRSPIKPKRRWRRWVFAAVAAVVVVVVAGPFVFIHFIEGSAPAPLSISTARTTASTTSTGPSGASATASVDGAWQVTTGSQAGYRVGEVLFGQSATAVGRTSAVTGNITINGTTVTAGTFAADLTKVSSDKSQRDEQFQGRIMDTATYPTATFTLTQPIDLGSIPADGTIVTERATGHLSLQAPPRR